ncbi:M28 family peptidase [Meridianimaribacter flavus]
MKKLLALIIVVLAFSCKNEPKVEVGPKITITSDELKEAVTYLSSDELLGRDTGTQGIDDAATYIEKQFESYGVKPYFETFRDNFKLDSLDAFNVVGVIEGVDETLKNEYIVIGAHYDHIGYGKPVENDSIANGANDNATGTAGVIAMAKYFATRKNNKRSILFALFTAEERGLLGSKHLAERLKSDSLNVYTMVNLEMIGVPFKDRDYQAFLTGYELSNMAEKMNAYAGSKLIGFSEVSKKYRLFMRSDNYPFYNQFKAPCQTLSSCDLTNFDFYHHVDDEIELMDFNFMANLINSTIPVIETMSNTPTKEIVMHEAE